MDQSSHVVRSIEWSIGSRDIFFTELNSGSVIKQCLHRAQLVTDNALDFTSMQVIVDTLQITHAGQWRWTTLMMTVMLLAFMRMLMLPMTVHPC